MSVTPQTLLLNNRMWAGRVADDDPTFFHRLEEQQTPDYLWIGCSDSRVPATQIVDLLPGEIFVHRNVANLIGHNDLNCLSAIQFAIDVLKVRHIIVCGHYGCTGVLAAIRDERHGLVDNWLRQLKKISLRYSDILDRQATQEARAKLLSELNVIHQVRNISDTTVVQDAWARGQRLTIHGWIYGVGDGILRDLDVELRSPDNVDAIIDPVLDNIRRGISPGDPARPVKTKKKAGRKAG